MNAKKKNKKANKPPNSNPPQKVENVAKSEEKVEEIQPKCEVKEQGVLTQEIGSVVVGVPVSDAKEVESETPNKPKRNKSKKKKSDKNEDFMEDVQEKPQEIQTELDVKVQEQIQEIKSVEKVNEENKDILDEASVVPSARKKKNKKKGQEKPEESTAPTEVAVQISKEHTTDNIKKVDQEIQELFSPKSEQAAQDPKKKKNKKKNRTDSERSDKCDTAVSCTTAFQNLLVEDKNLDQEQSEVIAKGNQDPLKNLPLERESIATEKSVKNVLDIQFIDEIKEPVPDKSQDTEELVKEEIKGKKKNKKDKRQQQKELFEDPKPEVQEAIKIVDVLPQTVPCDEPEQAVKESIQVPLGSKKEREPSPKPKAKIAKPVEKKRKGKQDAPSLENLLDIESTETLQHDTKNADLFKEPEIKSEELPVVAIIESQVSERTPQEQTAKVVENINVPSDKAMGKKRKKSPKPPKNKEVKADIEEMTEKAPADVVPEIKQFGNFDVLDLKIQPEVPIVSTKPVEIPPKISDLSPVETLVVTNVDPAIEKTETIFVEQPLTPDVKKDDEGFEIKTGKKKKKIPKIPQVQVSSEATAPTTSEMAKSDDKEETPKQLIEEKIGVLLDISLAMDRGVQSIKIDEIDALSCDAIPDVLFVRSSSQQRLDDNNNTVIQELINVDDIKLNDPILIPLVEGSGETPICTPEIITSGIIMTELEAKTPTDEKTDIKSKMMEVNQDMQELKLSIERSLAEFTALEKSENEAEKKCKGTTSLTKEKSPLKDSDNKATKNVLVKKEKSPFKDSKNKGIKETITIEKKENIAVEEETKKICEPSLLSEDILKSADIPPVCPARKDNKGKSKSKKKGKQETAPSTTTASSESTATQSKDTAKDEKQEKSDQKSEQKSESTQEKGKKQSDSDNLNDNTDTLKDTDNEKPMKTELISGTTERNDFDPIENFEDALTSSNDDVNRSFEIIAKEVHDDNEEYQKKLAANKPKINITEPTEDTDTKRNEKENPVSQPKNLLGHTDIPVQSNRTDYKKEKNKTPNARQARVKIKDSMDVEAKKQCKESQTDNKKAKSSDKSVKESFTRVKNDNEEYVYKYSFRKVFLQSACHVCNKDVQQARVPCGYCNLVFYCSAKHKDENWPQHQALCFAVSTLAHMKDQKHIYADAQHATGQDYRLLRMQMIVSCEKVLKRRLVPWEQEAMLYPRICADVSCREWRQAKLKDCDGCGQLSYCASHPDHLPKSHSRWCKSYSLYRRLVGYQQSQGRLEPPLPTKVLARSYMLEKMNDVLAALYEEKIDMNDIQYAALTQLATAPLTASYCLQLHRKGASVANGISKKHPLTIHVVGAELQFEADALNKWETFFLHLRPEVQELTVVLVSSVLNPGNLPLDLLGKIKLCDNCQQNKRRVVFKFEDNKNYFEYRSSEDFINPDIICAFNPSIQRSSIFNGKDPWPAAINSILKLKQPFVVTSYTLAELRQDIARIQQVSERGFKLVLEPGFNGFASVRPDRNFISDDEMPLLFKNYCVAVVVGC